MNSNKCYNIFLNILSAIPLISFFALYNKLPDKIASSFDFSGNITEYSSKGTIAMLFVLPIVILIVLQIAPKIDPKANNYSKFSKIYNNIKLLIVIILNITFLSIIINALYPNIVLIHKVIILTIGVSFVFLGKWMPQIQPNFIIGIRTPWTLSSEEVWTKTHKIGGICFIIGGTCFIIGAICLIIGGMYFIIGGTTSIFFLFFSRNVLPAMLLIAAGIAGLIPIIMSYMYYKNLHIDKEKSGN